VLSNDSFQEFHGEHPWLFDRGRLIGATPVPGIGWIFTPRTPVRGPTSRKAVRETDRAKRQVTKAIKVATKEAVGLPSSGQARRARSADSHGQPRHVPDAALAKPALAAVNDPLTFVSFIAEHPLGAEVLGRVEGYTSHGAIVMVGNTQCYVPLANLAEPPPRSAREVLKRGEERVFILRALDAQRRGAELALPGVAVVSGQPSEAMVEAEMRLAKRRQVTSLRELGPMPVPSKPPPRKQGGAPAAPAEAVAAEAAEAAPAADAKPTTARKRSTRRASSSTKATTAGATTTSGAATTAGAPESIKSPGPRKSPAASKRATAAKPAAAKRAAPPRSPARTASAATPPAREPKRAAQAAAAPVTEPSGPRKSPAATKRAAAQAAQPPAKARGRSGGRRVPAGAPAAPTGGSASKASAAAQPAAKPAPAKPAPAKPPATKSTKSTKESPRSAEKAAKAPSPSSAKKATSAGAVQTTPNKALPSRRARRS